MKRKLSSAAPDPLDNLLRGALATQAMPDPQLLCQVRRNMRREARFGRALPWLAAMGGSVLTMALVFALTILLPNPPWKQTIEVLGYGLCACTWLAAALSVTLLPRFPAIRP